MHGKKVTTIKGKPKYNTAQNVIWMLKVAWKTPRKRVPCICLLAAALDVLLQVVQLYVAPEILNAVEAHVPLGKLLQTILFFTAALLLLRGVKRYIKENTMFPRIDVRMSVMEMISKKCMSTSYPNTFDADFLKLRDTANTACESNDKATEHIWQTLTELLKNVGGFLVFLTILSRLELPLLLLMTATCAASFCVSAYSKNRIFAKREEEERYYRKKYYLRRSASSVEMAKDIRIFGLQDWLNALLDSVHDLYLDFRLKCERVELLADLTEALLTVARNAIAYVYLIHMALRDGLSVSEFLLYFTAVSGFTQWVMGILQETDTLRKECMDIARIREFLEFPEPFRFEGGEPIPEAAQYELRLEHVSFRYAGAERDILSDFDLTVRAGEKLAVVGLNGAGKTTLVKLLCGLLDPTSGRVLLNGRDIRNFDRKEYYRLFAAVFQEYSVLPVSVEENIAQAARIDPQRVSDCLEKAGLRETIEALSNGTKTHVGREIYLDGVLFSGGQTQRLMLARALYRDAPILLLDEPTAALDPLAESDIYEKYSAMTQGKTSLFISHRLASTRFCDRILLIADGKIAEEGTHESLLARGGKYASLFEVQSRYYREGKEF